MHHIELLLVARQQSICWNQALGQHSRARDEADPRVDGLGLLRA